MSENTVTQKSEFLFRRRIDSFDQFAGDLFDTAVANPVALALLVLAAAAVAARVAFRFAAPAARAPGAKSPTAYRLAVASWVAVAAYVGWVLVAFYTRDGDPTREPESVNRLNQSNTVKWYAFTGAVFGLGAVFAALMYVRDTRTVRWFWALPLALLRVAVYAVLCAVFLLPAMQTWEESTRQSRVVILLDISPSVTDPRATDEVGTGPGRKPRTRMDILIEFLTDDRVAFLKNLLDKNPVAVYAFGTRLDETPQMVEQGAVPWAKAEWEAFASYDFKPFVLRDLSADGKDQLRKLAEWNGDKPGTADWATSWKAKLADPELQKALGLSDPADADRLKKNLERLDKRIEVAKTIALGTNVADSVLTAVNREAPNMVQGIVVFSDGRSNLGGPASVSELRARAEQEKIPIFTVALGEDRQRSSIVITDLTAPDGAPIDEPWKVAVEADGLNLAGKEVEVFLDVWLPGRDMKTAAADHTLTEKLTFAPGDPPHGQTEFVFDPAKLPEKLTEESKDAAIKKRVLKEGKWALRARIAKDPQEAFPDPEHVRDRPEVSVVQQKLRVLLVAGAPGREFTFIRTLLVREVQDKRATLTTYIQNDAGTSNKLTAEEGEQLLQKFPDRLDLGNKTPPDDKKYNLNEYDVIVAFDPDWSELNQSQADDLARWVREGGGGLVYAAGPINTFQLAPGREVAERMGRLLDVLPVIPADIVALRIKSSPKTPRRLYLYPERVLGAELLKLDDKVPDDPKAGWEPFFTDREKYAPNPDLREELNPRRGFFSCYPVKEVKANSAVLADFADVSDAGEAVRLPWYVVNNPSAPYRTAFLASPELHKMRAYEPDSGTGREYFERFWVRLIKYAAAKRNVKAPRGRLMVSKEGVSGAPLRVQARILNESAKPYPPGGATPKFRIVREAPNGEKREFGPFAMAEKANAGAFDGYYAGQEMLNPTDYPPGDYVYRVVIDVPDSPGDTLAGEFSVRKSDPEMDNTKPDFAALLRMASDFDKAFSDRIPTGVAIEFGKELPKEAGMPKLAFRIGDRKLLPLIPECFKTVRTTTQNRGPVEDLWDKPLRVRAGPEVAFTPAAQPPAWEFQILNFDLTPERAAEGLTIGFWAAVGLLLLRGAWAAVSESVSEGARRAAFWGWMGACVVAVVVLSLLTAYEAIDAWELAVSVLVVGVAAFAFAADRWTGLIALGLLAATTGAVKWGFLESWGYTGANVQVGFVLLTVVALLAVEWVGRKLLRLA
jgi:hypothetical protein